MDPRLEQAAELNKKIPALTPELEKMQNDPNFILEVAVGPPLPELVPQQQTDGIKAFGKFNTMDKPKRFIVKKAHLSTDDFRIWDFDTGKLVYNSHHPGKNPVESVDLLGTAHQSDMYSRTGEWESYCDVTGHEGYPSLKIRPKTFSRHGTQKVMDMKDTVLFTISKESKLKSKSLRPNFCVDVGDGGEPEYHVTGDLMERTMQIINPKEETVCFIQKSGKTLIMNAAFGQGSEMLVDVAPGVDCSTMLAIIIGLKQVGTSLLKDAMGNYVTDPFKDSVSDTVLESTGEFGQMAVSMNNQAVNHADKATDHGHGRKNPIQKLPPDLLNMTKGNSYKKWGL
mmetsp:Transcript_1628/g.2744  ORF Transcript_1628/g.2744 Transcript_1628/m.2744 type:complete len:340 (+) Transcript_1628:282-1301(+)